MFFAWRFILNENILFCLTISYQKSIVFPVSVFCSQICTLKLNLWPKNWSDLCISVVKWFFFNFCLRKYFYYFLCWIFITNHDVSQQYCEIFRKIEQAKLVENLPLSYLPYRFVHNLHSFFCSPKGEHIVVSPSDHLSIRPYICQVHWEVSVCIGVWFIPSLWVKNCVVGLTNR